MAKVLIGTDYGSYTFNAASKQITFVLPNSATVKLERILLITNVITNEIIYNFSNPALGGSLSGNVLTLDFNTTSMSNSDSLQLWYYNEIDTLVYDDNSNAMRLIAQTQLSNMHNMDSAGRLRVYLDATANNITINSINGISNLGTLTTLTTLSNLGTYNATPHIPYTTQIPVEIQLQKIIVT